MYASACWGNPLAVVYQQAVRKPREGKPWCELISLPIWVPCGLRTALRGLECPAHVTLPDRLSNRRGAERFICCLFSRVCTQLSEVRARQARVAANSSPSPSPNPSPPLSPQLLRYGHLHRPWDPVFFGYSHTRDNAEGWGREGTGGRCTAAVLF